MKTLSRTSIMSYARIYCFILCLLLLLLDRVHILTLFHFRWVDDDQALLWHAASDLARGQLFEPRFYGQAYSTWLEALPAALLLLLGIPHQFALPISTLTFALLPFILLSIYAMRNGKTSASLFILIIPLGLPLNYALITAMPRGFTPGIALGTISLVLASSAQGLRGSFFAALLGGLSLSINPNSAPLVVAAGVMESAKLLKAFGAQKLFTSILGLGAAGALHLAVQAFYRWNPDYAAHPNPHVHFSLGALREALGHLGDFTGWYSPLSTLPVILPLGLLVVPCVLLAKQHRHVCIAYLCGVAVLCAALSLTKVQDGSSSIYQPLGRMFLAAPVLWAWALGHARWRDSTFLRSLVILFGLALCLLRLLSSAPEIQRLVIAPEHQVQATLVAKVKAECGRLATLSEELRPDVIVFGVHPITKILNYACPALWSVNATPTIFPAFERRTWRIREELLTTRSRLLLYEMRRTSALRNAKTIVSRRILGRNPLIEVVETLPIELPALLESVNVPIQRVERSRRVLRRRKLLRPFGSQENFDKASRAHSTTR